MENIEIFETDEDKKIFRLQQEIRTKVYKPTLVKNSVHTMKNGDEDRSE